jgi:hypothetical protein
MEVVLGDRLEDGDAILTAELSGGSGVRIPHEQMKLRYCWK